MRNQASSRPKKKNGVSFRLLVENYDYNTKAPHNLFGHTHKKKGLKIRKGRHWLPCARFEFGPAECCYPTSSLSCTPKKNLKGKKRKNYFLALLYFVVSLSVHEKEKKKKT